MPLELVWRGSVANDEVNALHAEAFEHRVVADDWVEQLGDRDEGLHAFYLDACGFTPAPAGLVELR